MAARILLDQVSQRPLTAKSVSNPRPPPSLTSASSRTATRLYDLTAAIEDLEDKLGIAGSTIPLVLYIL